MKLLSALALGMLMPSIVLSGEVASFTNRHQNLDKMRDSTHAFNRKIQSSLKSTISKLNRSRKACYTKQENADKHISSLKKLAGAVEDIRNDYLEDWIDENISNPTQLDIIRSRKNNSVYRDFGWRNSISIRSKFMRFDDYLIGSDKFTHFFSAGYKYYKASLDGSNLKDILEIGIRQENRSKGIMTTDVFSFGDLAANFSGFIFFSRLTKDSKDVLTGNSPEKPLFDCVANKWVMINDFELSDYLDASWDEAVNCSRYSDRTHALNVKNRTEELEKQDKQNRSYTCSQDLEALRKTREKYGNAVYPFITNEIPYLYGYESYQRLKNVEKQKGRTPNSVKDIISFGDRANEKTLNSNRFSVLLWNTYKGRKDGWGQDLLTEAPKHDFLMFQEMKVDPEMKNSLARLHGYEWNMAVSFNHKGYDTGVATAAKISPLKSSMLKTLVIEKKGNNPKVTLFSIFSIANKKVLFINIHALTMNKTKEFTAELERIEVEIKKHSGPIIFGGDFNTWKKSRTKALTKIIARNGMSKVPVSNDPRAEGSRMSAVMSLANPQKIALDHIFVRDVKKVSARVLTHVESSDHFPISYEFSL